MSLSISITLNNSYGISAHAMTSQNKLNTFFPSVISSSVATMKMVKLILNALLWPEPG